MSDRRHVERAKLRVAPSALCNVDKATVLAGGSSSCRRSLSGHGGSDVCVGDVAGHSKWSSLVGRKCPWLTLHRE